MFLKANRLKQLPNSIVKLQNLENLYLQENRLTFLPEEIGELQNLKELHLQGANSFSEKEREKIQELLPKCKIYFE
ncbi:leucine-rich repeat domain-containing protein [Leptospira kirschneri]|uniref:leucine-rich repeat domain-containing protein n=1 Tax=Leptospira TaxID=171 RepID=UPI0002BD8AD2|nr:leucine-rich repeat domain-containing protein [Leptospira kirschneri]EMJ91560.1 leucine rich repeat protein [Leptospira kirschneri str. JB]EMK05647.1 leucine rich repeat protein [Leptospira kirschneri]EMO75457.1 leucine rich repeat protein [Leptospira kirschneri str. 200801925]